MNRSLPGPDKLCAIWVNDDVKLRESCRGRAADERRKCRFIDTQHDPNVATTRTAGLVHQSLRGGHLGKVRVTSIEYAKAVVNTEALQCVDLILCRVHNTRR